MYKSMSIKGFKLFEEISMDNFSRINVFLGSNNCGKSSLLEAIYIHACGLNFSSLWAGVISSRENNIFVGKFDIGEKLISLFNKKNAVPYEFSISAQVENDSRHFIGRFNFQPSAEISSLNPQIGSSIKNATSGIMPDVFSGANQVSISGLIGNQNFRPEYLGKWTSSLDDESRTFDLYIPGELNSTEPFKIGAMHDVMAHRQKGTDVRIFSALKRSGILREFIKEMKEIFPYISDIDTIPYPDGSTSTVYIASEDGENLPLYSYGDGMRRWFYLVGSMVLHKNAVHCIEEIESTFHVDAQKKLSQLLVQYAYKFDNQLFITTHSMEFIDNFFDALYADNGAIKAQEEDIVKIFTIKRNKKNQSIDLWTLGGREAYEKRQKFELELR